MSAPLHALFIPGWGSTAEVWREILSASPDVTPHHLSWHEVLHEGSISITSALAALPRPRVLVGWSLGALLALQSELETPGAADHLLLVSSTARLCAEGEYPGASSVAVRAMRARVLRQPARVMADFAGLAFAPENDETARTGFLQQTATFTPEQLAAGLDALASLDLRSRLAGIRTPATLLHGEADTIIPHPSAQFLAAHLPDARLTMLAGRGHALPFTAAGEVAAFLRRFAS